ncbi:WD repeat-containing alr3466-like [Octopus vulgaris]|uniref:WD repeat-containing alr3466-like n=1 Tax=Octopus vulgaris TaxID=6645 RepID=A0AA36BGG1_OCTVU|nr:WD repeat-containing alr3466-like [Octopus vulgaris]
MAMEKHLVVKDVHTRCVTALGYNPTRREIVIGCQDGTVRCWDVESGKLSQAYREHIGWLGSPIHCMTMNFRRRQLLCGSRNGIRIYKLDENKECGHVIDPSVLHIAKYHTDIICAVVCHESRIYSGGIVTGSFDKTVKIWSIDGNQVHKIDNFLAPISSICYCPRDRTIWVTAGLPSACLFEPKSGDNLLRNPFYISQQTAKEFSHDGKELSRISSCTERFQEGTARCRDSESYLCRISRLSSDGM